jgi:hypothetical protein
VSALNDAAAMLDLYRFSWPIPSVLVESCQGIEDCAFSGIWISGQGDGQVGHSSNCLSDIHRFVQHQPAVR